VRQALVAARLRWVIATEKKNNYRL
jgi:hypothetical protein